MSEQPGRAWIDVVRMLHHADINGPVTEETVGPVLERFGIPVHERELTIKATWHMFKQFHVYNLDGLPMFFIKELWQPQAFQEILALHLSTHFIDRELGPKQYLFGTWRRKGMDDKPIVITSYVRGTPLKKQQVDEYMFELGRQYAYHQVLAMYDVDYRHFIVQHGTMARIDFGRAFTNLTMPYQGFWDFNYKRLVKSRAFHEGIDEENQRVQRQLDYTRGHLQALLSRLEDLGDEYRNRFVDFPMKAFIALLRAYWEKHVPFPVLRG